MRLPDPPKNTPISNYLNDNFLLTFVIESFVPVTVYGNHKGTFLDYDEDESLGETLRLIVTVFPEEDDATKLTIHTSSSPHDFVSKLANHFIEAGMPKQKDTILRELNIFISKLA